MKLPGRSILFLSAAALIIISCNKPSPERPPAGYVPGFGEFMAGIQVHHAKLWFAGQNRNWPLAEFETGEIAETINDLQRYCTDRPETKMLPMLQLALDSVNIAIKAGNLQNFNLAFAMLTATCNTCHQEVHFGFNRIIIPDTPPFANQDFAPHEQK